MKRIVIAVGLVVLFFSVELNAQAPKPYPELKQLEPFLGEWSIQGETKTTPVGKAGEFTATQATNWIFGGFFLQWEFGGKDSNGEFKGIEIDSYDPKNRVFRAEWWLIDGTITTGTYTPHGKTIGFSGKTVTPEKQFNIRQKYTFSDDGMSFQYTDEVSIDGKTWYPATESKGIRVKGPKN